MNSTSNPTSGDRHTLGATQLSDQTLPPDQRVRRAVARIEASRSALVVCLAPDPPKRRGNTTGAADGSGDRDANLSLIDTLKARIERNGLLQGSWRTARTLARRWWTRQSWHRSVDLVVETLAHEARPLIRNHPMATLAVGAALGAGIVAVASALRPWASHQMRGNGSTWSGRVGNLLWSQFSSAPMQMAVAGALTAWVADQGIRRKAQSSGPSGGGAASHGDQTDGGSSMEMPKSAL